MPEYHFQERRIYSNQEPEQDSPSLNWAEQYKAKAKEWKVEQALRRQGVIKDSGKAFGHDTTGWKVRPKKQPDGSVMWEVQDKNGALMVGPFQTEREAEAGRDHALGLAKRPKTMSKAMRNKAMRMLGKVSGDMREEEVLDETLLTEESNADLKTSEPLKQIISEKESANPLNYLNMIRVCLPALLAIPFLLFAAFCEDVPDNFYKLLRVYVAAASLFYVLYGLFLFLEKSAPSPGAWTKATFTPWALSISLVFLVILILFNPVLPVHMKRDEWALVDACCAIPFFLFIVVRVFSEISFNKLLFLIKKQLVRIREEYFNS